MTKPKLEQLVQVQKEYIQLLERTDQASTKFLFNLFNNKWVPNQDDIELGYALRRQLSLLSEDSPG